MMRLGLILRQTADAVFSAGGGSLGGHIGLNHIPGAALLGFAAARLYDSAGDGAFALFHSGRVRFGDAYPLTTSRLCGFPVPQTLRRRKAGGGGIAHGGLQAEEVRNQSYADRPGGDFGEQSEGLGTWFVAHDLTATKPLRSYRMKTAITEGTRTASDAQLFGYDHLSGSNGEFYAVIELDDDVEEGVRDKLRSTFDGVDLMLGRSAASEFGGAFRCQIVEAPTDPRAWPTSKDVVLWCISDLALQDEYGSPLLAPRPVDIGLGPGRLIGERSAIQHRRWSPWNRKLGARDVERVVIKAGSVLFFHFEDAVSTSALEAGVGLYRECGLGRFWVNPSLLADPVPVKQPVGEHAIPAIASHTAPVELDLTASDETVATLLKSLRAKASENGRAAAIDRLAEHWKSTLSRQSGATSSQWSRVAAAARLHCGDRTKLRRTLFDAPDAVCGERDKAWKELRSSMIEIFDQGGNVPGLSDLDRARALELAAGDLRRRVKEKQR